MEAEKSSAIWHLGILVLELVLLLHYLPVMNDLGRVDRTMRKKESIHREPLTVLTGHAARNDGLVLIESD